MPSSSSHRSAADIGRRDHHALVYDAARGRTVLFGGNSGPSPWPTDTWLWDGTAWTRAATEGPIGRGRSAMAYDAARETAHLEDMWQWDGQRWTEIPLKGPTPGKRYSPAMAFDPGRGRMVLHGGLVVRGRGDFTALDDVWEWDGSGWSRRQ